MLKRMAQLPQTLWRDTKAPFWPLFGCLNSWAKAKVFLRNIALLFATCRFLRQSRNGRLRLLRNATKYPCFRGFLRRIVCYRTACSCPE